MVLLALQISMSTYVVGNGVDNSCGVNGWVWVIERSDVCDGSVRIQLRPLASCVDAWGGLLKVVICRIWVHKQRVQVQVGVDVTFVPIQIQVDHLTNERRHGRSREQVPRDVPQVVVLDELILQIVLRVNAVCEAFNDVVLHHWRGEVRDVDSVVCRVGRHNRVVDNLATTLVAHLHTPSLRFNQVVTDNNIRRVKADGC